MYRSLMQKPRAFFIVSATLLAAVVVSLFWGNVKFSGEGFSIGNFSIGNKVTELDESKLRIETTRLLNLRQYRNSIHDVFGEMIDVPDQLVNVAMRTHGLIEVGASEAGMSPVGFEMAEGLARHIAAQVVGENYRLELVPCTPTANDGFDQACAKQFIIAVGRLLYRRPLVSEELAQQLDQARSTAEREGFYAGLERSLINMLVSPNFLFRIEYAAPDGDGDYQLDAYSRAARLSFLFWNSAPDAPLLNAAERGELYHRRGLQQQIDRLLASPKLEEGVRAFFHDMLAFDRFDTLIKDATLFPEFTYRVIGDAREQTLRTLVDHLLVRRGDYRDLFTTRHTFLTPVLAAQLAVPLHQNNPNGLPDYWQAYEYPEGDPRAGLLAQPSFTALHSHPGRTSPTLRGKALREHLLCQEVPPPPPNVDFQLVQNNDNTTLSTMRERLSAHATNATCAGCHKITDPIGLALENFDSGGRYRTTENNLTIDASGELDGARYTSPAGLAQAVRNNSNIPNCLVKRVYAYGAGHSVQPSERKFLKTLNKQFAASGYTLPALLGEIALSDEFYRAREKHSGQVAAR